jgi:hypothetical protein
MPRRKSRSRSKSRKRGGSRSRSRKVPRSIPKKVAPPPKKEVDVKEDYAQLTMSLSTLQDMAKSRGIPFGGLTKSKLVRKLNTYH